jgi:hypothetical protein
MLTINLCPKTAMTLEHIYVSVYPLEFSGLAVVDMKKSDLKIENGEIKGRLQVGKFYLLDIGNEGYTEFNLDPKIIPVSEWPLLKVWIHAHGVGNAVPGPHNWSTIDQENMEKSPCGNTPAEIGWAVAVVRNRYGFTAQMRNYKKEIVQYCLVTPQVDFDALGCIEPLYQKALARKGKKYIQTPLGFDAEMEDDDDLWHDEVTEEELEAAWSTTLDDEEDLDDEDLYDEQLERPRWRWPWNR